MRNGKRIIVFCVAIVFCAYRFIVGSNKADIAWGSETAKAAFNHIDSSLINEAEDLMNANENYISRVEHWSSMKSVSSTVDTPTETPVQPISEVLNSWLSGVKDYKLIILDWSDVGGDAVATPAVTEIPELPTAVPTLTPTEAPTEKPTIAPTEVPTEMPTAKPLADISCDIAVDELNAKVNIYISNTFDDDKNVVIAVAQYDDAGVLVNIKLEEVIVPANTILPEEYEIKADQVSDKKQTIKGFVWDGTTSMKPIRRNVK